MNRAVSLRDFVCNTLARALLNRGAAMNGCQFDVPAAACCCRIVRCCYFFTDHESYLREVSSCVANA